MDFLLIVALVVLSIFGCYMFLQKSELKIEEYEDKIPESPKKKKVDLTNKTHVGWLYKNGSENTDGGNYTLYFDNATSSFLIASIWDDEFRNVELDNVREGMGIVLDNIQYYVHIWKEKDE